MSSDIQYIGRAGCRIASLQCGDDASLREATREMSEDERGVVGVRIEQFLTEKEVSALIGRTRYLLKRKMESPSMENELATVGISQQTGSRNKAHYFDLTEAWSEEPAFAQSVGEGSDVLRRVIQTFEKGYDVPFRPATEKGRSLLPATLRTIDYTTTHRDVVASQTSWEISRLRNDVGWNVYLHMPKQGGDLVLFPHETARYSSQRDVNRFTPISVRPDPGDLIFFRSGTPHSVTRSSEQGGRLTISGCAAFEPPPDSGGRYWA